ncbi:putative transposase [Corallococcus macrosporus]|uniref:Putative transposase n=2 Tax=Myxococcaceae TaxID=31 RepID=F8C766_MYXFH|nr:putative transposase [Corallococcus macrosporus]AEI67098.1 putative transposase [Corallococcus macrosporus]AEI69206.1 putative transposase [Corallococcus macrosporus]
MDAGSGKETSMDELVPKDHGEEIAVFRSQVIGPVVHRQLTRGELRGALRELTRQKFRPPGAERTWHFSMPTLERWYYRFRRHGLAALRPQPRKDAGRAKALDERQKQLVCDVRREHLSASAELILTTLVRQGRVREGAVSAATVRRLLAERGLDRVSLRGTGEGVERRRWEAAYPGALWHGDVCHGPVLTGGTKWEPLRIHALLDDRSHYVVALEARSTEREDDMLGLLVRAARQHGVPETLYLDNRSSWAPSGRWPTSTGAGPSTLTGRPSRVPWRWTSWPAPPTSSSSHPRAWARR